MKRHPVPDWFSDRQIGGRGRLTAPVRPPSALWPAGMRGAVRSGTKGGAVQGAKGAPVRAVGSPRISPTDGLRRPAHLFAAPSPRGVPPVRIRSPSPDSHVGRPPLNDHHREVAVLMVRTLPNRRGKGGRFGLQFGCARACATVRANWAVIRRVPAAAALVGT